MKKTLLALGAAVAVAAPTALVATPASANAGSPGCVTRVEYNAVKKGWTKYAVDRKFGTHGRRLSGATSGGYTFEVWSYKPCSRYSAISISYEKVRWNAPRRLSSKAAVWVY